MGRIPIAGGEHEFTLYGFRELLEARAVDYIQFDTNRVGGITAGAQNRRARRGAFRSRHPPCRPDAQLSMSSWPA